MIAIRVSDVHKKYKVYHDKGSSLKEKILFRNRNYHEDRWVLNGISLDVKKGESVGLIGHNGCGKSTLLKLLTKIIYPDSGLIEMKGRVSSLIELGAGFHPDMSGRENVYTNASIFGLTKKEINKRIDKIIRFSELEEFIDNPVRTYSSGMYMRLAFAVAINVDADILLIDEILAVGDASFQTKCFNKLREIKSKGTTIVIVSHSLGQVEQICDRSIWINDGKILMEDTPRNVHPYYLEFMGKKNLNSDSGKNDDKIAESLGGNDNDEYSGVEAESVIETEKDRWGNMIVRIEKIDMMNHLNKKSNSYKTGDKLDIIIEYKSRKIVQDMVVGIGIFRSDGINCYGTNTHIDRLTPITSNKEGKVVVSIDELNLLPGEYSLDVALHTSDGFDYDYCKNAEKFIVYSDIQDSGVVRLNHRWTIN